MTTVISTTNRPGNKTILFARAYYELLLQRDKSAKLFSMEDFPSDINLTGLYQYNHTAITQIVENYILPADKMVVFIPEYNGSFPGIFKLLIDSLNYEILKGKKVALVGISSGRSGNARGIDHLTNIFNYLGVEVYSFKVPVSRAETLIKDGKVTDEETLRVFNRQIEGFLAY